MNEGMVKVFMKLATLPPIKEMIKSITQEQTTEGMKILKRAYELMHPSRSIPRIFEKQKIRNDEVQ